MLYILTFYFLNKLYYVLALFSTFLVNQITFYLNNLNLTIVITANTLNRESQFQPIFTFLLSAWQKWCKALFIKLGKTRKIVTFSIKCCNFPDEAIIIMLTSPRILLVMNLITLGSLNSERRKSTVFRSLFIKVNSYRILERLQLISPFISLEMISPNQLL